MKIIVDIHISERKGYDSHDVASAKLEIEAPWDDVKPTSVHNALAGAIEDVTDRVNQQLRAIQKARIAAERAAAEVEAEKAAVLL